MKRAITIIGVVVFAGIVGTGIYLSGFADKAGEEASTEPATEVAESSSFKPYDGAGEAPPESVEEPAMKAEEAEPESEAADSEERPESEGPVETEVIVLGEDHPAPGSRDDRAREEPEPPQRSSDESNLNIGREQFEETSAETFAPKISQEAMRAIREQKLGTIPKQIRSIQLPSSGDGDGPNTIDR